MTAASEHSALRGKIALVTGAGRGLGRAFAETLAGLGCQVGLHGMREHGPAEYGEGTTLTDTARAVAVFAGPTGDFITGQVLRVDGGQQCWPA
jgi:3-oxoacyl-[acyl-carrier protein] reductase